MDGLNGEVLYWALRRRGHLEVTYVPNREELVEQVKPLLRVDDMVIVLGAGSIHTIAEDLVRALTGQENTWTMQ